MHVYTMGTRAYAEEVCKAIDPARKLFGNRIISRDESGSKCRACKIIYSLSSTRLNTEESAKTVPLRYLHGRYH